MDGSEDFPLGLGAGHDVEPVVDCLGGFGKHEVGVEACVEGLGELR
jgi:hypothetical protein